MFKVINAMKKGTHTEVIPKAGTPRITLVRKGQNSLLQAFLGMLKWNQRLEYCSTYYVPLYSIRYSVTQQLLIDVLKNIDWNIVVITDIFTDITFYLESIQKLQCFSHNVNSYKYTRSYTRQGRNQNACTVKKSQFLCRLTRTGQQKSQSTRSSTSIVLSKLKYFSRRTPSELHNLQIS